MYRLVRRAALAATTTGALVVGLAAPQAHALPPANGTHEVIALAGSDTIQDVMGALSSGFNSNATFNPGGGNSDQAVNIPPVLATGQSFTVPGDGNCGPTTYNAGNPPPNGSSSGISALNSDTQGCIDVARSSRGRGTEPATDEFYAFAKDAVSWAYFGKTCTGHETKAPTGCAPKNLTQQNLKDIFLCTKPDPKAPGKFKPAVGTWDKVGGEAAKITRVLPQIGSGTLSFFETKVLGLTSAQQGVLDDTQCSKRPVRAQENSGTDAAAKLGSGTAQAQAILPYSFAQWTAQSNHVVSDIRSGVKLGSINGVKPSSSTISADQFLGARYVYNVLKTSSPSYNAALRFVGADSTGNGYLCSGTAATTIANYGFVAIGAGPLFPGGPSSRCRLNPTPL